MRTSRRRWTTVRWRAGAVGLTLAFVLVEALCGWFGNSLALVSDADHNLADAAALGFSWYAMCLAGRPSHEGMTYGYHQMGILPHSRTQVRSRSSRSSSLGKPSPDFATRKLPVRA